MARKSGLDVITETYTPEEEEWIKGANVEREAERNELRNWAAHLDRYPGSVRDYSAFKGEPFEEITFEKGPFKRNVFHVVVDGSASDWGYLAQLMDSGECVGFVHYVPIQLVGYNGVLGIYTGGYGLPVRKIQKKLDLKSEVKP